MEKIYETLRKKGYKLTAPRLAVLKALTKQHKPLSAQAVWQQTAGINLASVYRSLNLFKKLNLVNAEKFNNEEIYCLSTNHAHHHIICEKCGYIQTFKCTHKFKIKNFTNIRHQLILVGICNKCN
ncbi:MAG: Fur family transcriptional regulator [Patescibacteria group bacterium]|jgi:Fe2+ or Zn2+ uptake regulation protein|nr:Fur family transcriptional regulator [Patescibacteria group bacterium]